MINFPFGTNGKLIILGVPILKHITVTCASLTVSSAIQCLVLSGYTKSQGYTKGG